MYTAKTFSFTELQGFTDRQLQAHLGLYNGYVANTNKLLSAIAALEKQGGEESSYALSEVRRRLGFEFNGMRLHEYYFEQFEQHETPQDSLALKEKLEQQFGSFDAWKEAFTKVGMTRGIGWTLLVEDEKTGTLFNVWVNDHEVGHLGGQKILLAMDVWEHAYLIDYLPSERKTYIDLFFENLHWSVVESRY